MFQEMLWRVRMGEVPTSGASLQVGVGQTSIPCCRQPPALQQLPMGSHLDFPAAGLRGFLRETLQLVLQLPALVWGVPCFVQQGQDLRWGESSRGSSHGTSPLLCSATGGLNPWGASPAPVSSPRSEDGCQGPGMSLKWGAPKLLQEGWASRETPLAGEGCWNILGLVTEKGSHFVAVL